MAMIAGSRKGTEAGIVGCAADVPIPGGGAGLAALSRALIKNWLRKSSAVVARSNCETVDAGTIPGGPDVVGGEGDGAAGWPTIWKYLCCAIAMRFAYCCCSNKLPFAGNAKRFCCGGWSGWIESDTLSALLRSFHVAEHLFSPAAAVREPVPLPFPKRIAQICFLLFVARPPS